MEEAIVKALLAIVTYNRHNIFIVQATDVDALFDDTRT
jgi:hypothetical protein